MAMRLYTKAELDAELRDKWRLTETKERTVTAVAWRTPNGKHVLVPVLPAGQRYPDYILDKIAEQLTAFGENPLKRT